MSLATPKTLAATVKQLVDLFTNSPDLQRDVWMLPGDALVMLGDGWSRKSDYLVHENGDRRRIFKGDEHPMAQSGCVCYPPKTFMLLAREYLAREEQKVEQRNADRRSEMARPFLEAARALEELAGKAREKREAALLDLVMKRTKPFPDASTVNFLGNAQIGAEASARLRKAIEDSSRKMCLWPTTQLSKPIFETNFKDESRMLLGDPEEMDYETRLHRRIQKLESAVGRLTAAKSDLDAKTRLESLEAAMRHVYAKVFPDRVFEELVEAIDRTPDALGTLAEVATALDPKDKKEQDTLLNAPSLASKVIDDRTNVFDFAIGPFGLFPKAPTANVERAYQLLSSGAEVLSADSPDVNLPPVAALKRNFPAAGQAVRVFLDPWKDGKGIDAYYGRCPGRPTWGMIDPEGNSLKITPCSRWQLLEGNAELNRFYEGY